MAQGYDQADVQATLLSAGVGGQVTCDLVRLETLEQEKQLAIEFVKSLNKLGGATVKQKLAAIKKDIRKDLTAKSKAAEKEAAQKLSKAEKEEKTRATALLKQSTKDKETVKKYLVQLISDTKRLEMAEVGTSREDFAQKKSELLAAAAQSIAFLEAPLKAEGADIPTPEAWGTFATTSAEAAKELKKNVNDFVKDLKASRAE